MNLYAAEAFGILVESGPERERFTGTELERLHLGEAIGG